ncbi:hypothetical protein PHSY_005738 [Pseudozyma hubeiensis SY62]|uniref:Uncharacterized protein n=1 Tax=Pseudozyma hubeiensis (strain SY62) TaxID=1305764 RepID=R9P9W6_PSEHS|nr:hypothetical protein PHSY_005738 [Pseudozyma hubeiensis SY62]GAC98149.1 hypothetical protein PHSY_005738 [Pseudozyma hubeiensis SY62]
MKSSSMDEREWVAVCVKKCSDTRLGVEKTAVSVTAVSVCYRWSSTRFACGRAALNRTVNINGNFVEDRLLSSNR